LSAAEEARKMRIVWNCAAAAFYVAVVMGLTGCGRTAPAQGGKSDAHESRPAEEERPGERVEPPPEVNPQAVVWRTSKPPTRPQAGDAWVNPKDGTEMAYVPPGEFIMGTSDAQIDALVNERQENERVGLRDARKVEQPQRRVHLDGFWMDKMEATVEQYREFCQATGRNMPQAPRWGWKEDHPMVNVSWDDAAAYASWADKRLPTEAEWEKAARGTDGRVFPWGNEWDMASTRRCNHAGGHPEFGRLSGEHDDGYPYTAPVGSFPHGASPYGCLDMAGNVWEWCNDWYGADYYKSAPSRGPEGPSSGIGRVLRGGCFHSGSQHVRCAHRQQWLYGDRRFGFRCARDGE
jgi:formylglycine-generating enzyme required for sulfatase activity